MLRSLLLAAAALPTVLSLAFDLDPSGVKCIGDDVSKDVLIKGDFRVEGADKPADIDVKVTDPVGNAVYRKEHAHEGRFAFTAKDDGEFLLCFLNNEPEKRRVVMHFLSGVGAHDFHQIAKKEHINPLRSELAEMESVVKDIHDEMIYMRGREEAMRNTNESTNARVLWFSLFSMLVMISMGVWQAFHLKNFFKTKKLI